MKAPTVKRVALLAVGVVASWIIGLAGSLTIAHFFSAAEVAEWGTAGDTFGSSTALFSALSFFGLVVVLWVETSDRKREREESNRPLLVPELVVDGIQVLEAKSVGGYLRASLALNVRIVNISTFPALNTSLELRGADVEPAETTMRDFPIKSGGEESAQIDLTLAGQKVTDLFTSLASGKTLRATLSASYQGLNAVDWTSSVDYDLRVMDVKTQDRLRKAAAGTGDIAGTEGAFAGADDAIIEMTPVPGSWKQNRANY